MRTIEKPDCWMVLYRHMQMPGGVLDYGVGQIVGFYDTFEEADKEAEKVFKEIKQEPWATVWVMHCDKTYKKAGIAVTKRKE